MPEEIVDQDRDYTKPSPPEPNIELWLTQIARLELHEGKIRIWLRAGPQPIGRRGN